MNIKSLRQNKLVNIMLWIGAFVLIAVIGIIQSRTTSAITGFMIEGNSELAIPNSGANTNAVIGIAKTIASFFSFISPFIRWVILSLILSYFVNLIQEDYTELEKTDVFLLVGYTSIILLISSLIVLLSINNVVTPTDFSAFMDASTMVNRIGTGIFYASLVIPVSVLEKFNIKKILILSSFFIVLFVVIHILLPMVAPK